MFTGIIEEIGEIVAVEQRGDSARLTVRGPRAVAGARHGDSIAVSGVCLTVVDQGDDWFAADVMRITLDMSTLSDAAPGRLVDLERAAHLGDPIGGHLVQGHIDGTATVASIEPGEHWRVIRFAIDAAHAPLVVRKGSIAVDGTSLTVSAVSDAADPQPWFEVSLIPETLAATTLGTLAVGDRVNIETDITARQLQRLAAWSSSLGAAEQPTDERGLA
ncbi:riboflavin synthase [Gryllotalpicola sp.]|uniref:riboflavin synthase n=1 Tax=Gryllotalpicola sp. TaxID=1932787 RepID=UPI00262C7DFC|nr:riboflavin synthase [Gryllotalpicola sp.]